MTMKKLLMCAAIMVILSVGSAHSSRAEDRWILVGHSKLAAFYYDRGNITRPTEGVVRVWIRQSPRAASSIEGPTITFYEFDCRNRTFCALRRTVYDAQGTIIFETNHRERREPIRRDTIPKKLYGLICEDGG